MLKCLEEQMARLGVKQNYRLIDDAFCDKLYMFLYSNNPLSYG